MKTITYIFLFITAISFAQTNNEYLQQGLKELGLDSVTVTIRPLDYRLVGSVDYDLKAHLIGGCNQYTIRLRKGLYSYQEKIAIAHELIHVVQYQSGELKQLGGRKMMYKGKKYGLVGTYYHRKWESDARNEGRELGKILRKHFKNKK